MLRNSGCIKLLKDAMTAAQDRELSLREAPKQKFRYGYGADVDEASLADMRSAFATDPSLKPTKHEVFHGPDEYEKVRKQREAERQEKIAKIARTPVKPWPMGVKEGHQGQPYSSEDGVAASTKMFCEDNNDENLVHEFIQHTAMELGIDPLPEIVLHTDPEWSTNNHSFGRYDPDSHTLNVSMPNRHILDVLRTVAHELVHCSQNQQHGGLPADAGETGSRWENDANARAGIIMRDWANEHPEHFDLPALAENASGYIPKNKREAAQPQYAMALSVDIKPGQTGKEANKLALNTGRNGEPGLLMKTVNLREYRMPQPSHGPGKYRDLNEPLGPETPPEMPDGTIKVDVSDMYDWYKLGQKISDLGSIKPGELGQGPPSTVFAFGSEDLENQYSHALTRLGLKTHDLDEPGEEDLDESIDADQVLHYVKKTHAPEEFNIEYSITDHPEWQLVEMPLSQLHLDPDGEVQDPYNRTNWVDYDTVNDLIPKIAQVLKSKPIVVDSDGWIIDGNHRAMAAAEAGLTSVPALVPVEVKEDVTESREEFEGMTIEMIKNGHVLVINALDDWGNNILGHVAFNIGDNNELDPQDLSVDERYQGQGIARAMYDYVKSKGYKIHRSWDQTDAGAGFWNKHRGENVRVWEQGMAENFADGKNPGRKGLAKRSGVNTKASVSDLRKTAKNSSGEKQRMAHWLANMKAGRAKAKKK
jgi:GNAT superfamily N-acetyltransferase